MTDIAETIRRAIYPGRTSRANAPANQNDDWQLGFRMGQKSTETPDPEDSMHPLWHAAHLAYLAPDPEKNPEQWARWSEWKKGWHAARLQIATARV